MPYAGERAPSILPSRRWGRKEGGEGLEPVLPLHPKRPGGAGVEEVEGTSSGWCLTLRVVGLWVWARPGSVCAPASLSFLRKKARPVPAAA